MATKQKPGQKRATKPAKKTTAKRSTKKKVAHKPVRKPAKKTTAKRSPKKKAPAKRTTVRKTARR